MLLWLSVSQESDFMDPNVLENIFTVLSLLIPGVILALFAAYFQTRKKSEILVETEIAKVRIRAYEEVMAVLSRVAQTVSPELDDDALIRGALAYCDYPDLNTDFPSFFSDEKSFDSFYDDLKQVGNRSYVYFGYDAEKQFENSIGVFSTMKMYLDAFADAERGQEEKINLAYRMAAVLMKSSVNAAYLKMQDLIAGKLSDVEITPGYRPLRRFAYTLILPLYRWADRSMRLTDWRGTVSNAFLGVVLGRDNLMKMHLMLELVKVMGYIHYSDRYTPSEYFEMDEDARLQLHNEFMLRLYPQIHRG